MSKVKTEVKLDFSKALDKMPQYHIIMHDDEKYTVPFLAKMFQEILYTPLEEAEKDANAVKTEKKEIVYTTHKELAELKVELIANYCIGFDKPAKVSIEKAI